MASALEEGLKTLALDDQYLLVAAIDFGTTFSAYAFSFKSSEKEIRMNKNWGAEVSFESYKTPTCVLTKPGGKFHSFGYTAEHEFNELDDQDVVIGGPNGYNLYRHFKMLLHEQGAKLSSTVTSTSGHVTKAINIFAMSLKYLKDHMLDAIAKSVHSPPSVSDIRWVITVPAIWTDESKRFMREAAYRGGLIHTLNSKQLLIALEPEAASVYCRQLEINQFTVGTDKKEDVNFKTGDKLIIIDAGGGTVDITAHEVQVTGNVKEIAPPSGGPWGGINVDAKFIALLTKILGPDFINHFKRKIPQQWMHFMILFEKAKKASKSDGKSSIKVALPYSFDTEFRDLKGRSIAEALKSYSDKDISFNNGFLTLKAGRVNELFRDIGSSITRHVVDLLRDKRLVGLKHILLVGGFGECEFLQESCQKDLAKSGCRVLVPIEAQLAIIKGAVLFGHKPFQITSRIAKMSYGRHIRLPFKEGKHDPKKKVSGRNGEDRALDCFCSFVTKGNEVMTGSFVTHICRPSEDKQSVTTIRLYKSEKTSVIHVDEPGVIKIGQIRLESSSGYLSDNLEVRATFGHTEMLVEARDAEKGEAFPVSTTIDFLSE